MHLKDEQGMIAIGVAIMLIVVLSLFGGVLWQYSMVEMRRVERTELDMQALFLARAGAEMVMGAWLEESVSNKPEGIMDRIYYNSDSGFFETTEPTNYLGYVDVTVNKIDEPGAERDQLTEIIATAVVRNSSRTVKVTTFPHLLGHDSSLKWYSENSGIIQPTNSAAEELVIVRGQKPIHFPNRIPPIATGFAAPVIIFEQALDLSYDQGFDWTLFPDPYDNYNYRLPIKGEQIFFSDLILFDLPTNRYSRYAAHQSVILKLPPGSSGIPGSQIAGASHSHNYGRVYFDGDIVGIQQYKWERSWLIFFRIVSDGKPLALQTPNKQSLAGNAFYFRDGTNLSNIKPQDLIPMPSEERRSTDLKDIQPFIWE